MFNLCIDELILKEKIVV